MYSKRWVGLLLLFGVVGCSGCMGPRAGSEQAARAHVTVEFNKWLAGQKSQAETMDARLQRLSPPMAFEIRSVVPDEPDLMASAKKETPSDWKSWPAFRFNVYIEWKSQANTPLKEATRYNLTWNPHEKKWYIKEHF